MIYKLQIFALFIYLNTFIYAQPIEPSPDYKYVLRIQRGIEAEVGYYLDEPKTGDLKKIHTESTKYLLLAEKDSKSKALAIRSERIKRAVGQMINKRYNPNIVRTKKRNIRYHYFLIDEFSKD